jgi:hypothetical protein
MFYLTYSYPPPECDWMGLILERLYLSSMVYYIYQSHDTYSETIGQGWDKKLKPSFFKGKRYKGLKKESSKTKVTETISDLSQCRQLTIPQTFRQYLGGRWDPGKFPLMI